MAVTLKQRWDADLINAPVSAWRLTGGSNPMTVTSGSTLALIITGFDSFPPDIIPAPADSAGTFTYDTTARSTQPAQNNTNLGIAIQANAAGGSHTITPALWANGTTTGGDGTIWIVEVTGVPTASPVRGSSRRMANNALQTWSVTSNGSDGSTTAGSAPQAGDIVFAAYTYENSTPFGTAGIPNPPSAGGWTSLGDQQDATNNLPAQLSYKVSTGTAESATWTANDTGIVTNLAAMLWLKADGPSITAQPANQVAKVGSTAAFSVSATASSGSLTYQWQSQQGGAWVDISGATSASYTTVTLAAGDSAGYRCNVTDSLGTVASNAASLTVALPRKAWRFDGRGGRLVGTEYFRPLQSKALDGIVASDFFDAAAAAGGTITGAGQIASGEAFGAVALGVALSPIALATAEAFGAPVLAATLTTAGIATGEGIGSAALAATVAAAAIASGEALGQPAVGAAPASIVAAGIASAEAAGAPTVQLQVLTAAVAGGEALGAATLAAGVAAAGAASGEALGQPVVSATAAGTVDMAGIASAEAFGAVQIGVQVLPVGTASAEAVAGAVLAAGVALAGVISAEAAGQPTVTANPLIVLAGVPSSEAAGAPSLSAGITGGFVDTAEALGLPTVQLSGPVQIDCHGIGSAEAFGSPRLGDLLEALAEGAGRRRFFDSKTPVRLGLRGVPSAEAFGAPIVLPRPPPVTLRLRGAPTAEALGISALAVSLAPAGIEGRPAQFGAGARISYRPTVEQLLDEVMVLSQL